MPISKTFTFAGTALLVLLFASHAYLYQSFFHDGVSLVTSERRMATDITPAARIRETFALFVPGDARRMRDSARFLARAVKPEA
jgi:hypothetical protein